jgi:hypothetical protein
MSASGYTSRIESIQDFILSFLSLLTRLKEEMPLERRNRTRSFSSDGLLKKSSMRPADVEGDTPLGIFVVIAVEKEVMATKTKCRDEKLTISSNR